MRRVSVDHELLRRAVADPEVLRAIDILSD